MSCFISLLDRCGRNGMPRFATISAIVLALAEPRLMYNFNALAPSVSVLLEMMFLFYSTNSSNYCDEHQTHETMNIHVLEAEKIHLNLSCLVFMAYLA